MSYYRQDPHGQGMGGMLDLFGAPSTPATGGHTGNDGEFAIPGNIPGNTSSSSGYVYITVNNRTYSVNTPAGYSLWPEVAKQAWIATQRSVLAGQGGAASSTDVRSIQAALNSLPSNLARLSVDGNYGAKTRARVIEFQQRSGLPATGVLDYLTSSRILAASPVTKPSGNNNSADNYSYNPAPPPKGNSSSLVLYGVLALVFVYVMNSD